MTALSSILAGGRILASAVQGVAPDAAYKGADESVTSSTALQNDDALFLALPVNSTWMAFAAIFYQGGNNGAGDLKWQWTVPAGASAIGGHVSYFTSGVGVGNVNLGAFANGATTVSGTNGAGHSLPVLLLMSVTIGSTAGNLQLQWAENTSNATPTIVKAGSLLAAWQVA